MSNINQPGNAKGDSMKAEITNRTAAQIAQDLMTNCDSVLAAAGPDFTRWAAFGQIQRRLWDEAHAAGLNRAVFALLDPLTR